MTIAACYVSHEGVVLGADSTTTYMPADGPMRHYHNAQKIFEIGELGSTLGMVTWGLGSLPEKSYRQIAAELSDDLIGIEPTTVDDVAQRFVGMFWAQYRSQLATRLQRFQALDANPTRTPVEQEEWERLLQGLFRRLLHWRACEARSHPQGISIAV